MKPPVKILCVYDVSYPSIEGGGQKRIYEVALNLIKDGYDITWVCFQTWEGDANFTDDNGVKYLGVSGYKGLYNKRGSRRLMEPLEFLINLKRKKIKFCNYDVIWAGQWPLTHLAWWVLRPKILGRAVLIVDWWEIWGRTWFTYSKVFGILGFLVEKFLIGILSRRWCLVMPSQSALEKAQSLCPTGNFQLIHIGINVKEIKNIKLQKSDVYDIAYIGRLKDHKRVDLLLNAIKLVKEKSNKALTAVIIGDGPEMQSLKLLSSSLGIQNQITFLGSIKNSGNVYQILKSAKIFVNPSVKEGGASITLLEAFACGLPVLAFLCRDGIDPNLIFDGEAGVLVKSVKAEVLAKAIDDLLNDPNKLSEFKRSALMISEDFDWTRISNQYKELIENHRFIGEE